MDGTREPRGGGDDDLGGSGNSPNRGVAIRHLRQRGRRWRETDQVYEAREKSLYIWLVWRLGSSDAARWLHHEASTEDVTTLHGPKTAEASAASGLFNTPNARPVAMPPFCMPTSKAVVR